MSKQSVTKGATNQIAYVWIRDSNSAVGAGLTGLVFNSGSLVGSYVRPGAARSAITLVTQTVTGAYSSGGFVEVDATNLPGLYRLDVPDAVFASGVNSAIVMLKGATNMEACVVEYELKGVDLQDIVRAGLTALPNAAAEAAGGLYTRGTGAGQINQPASGVIDSNTKTWNGLTTVALPLVPTTAGRTLDVSTTGEAGIDWANVGSPTTAVGLSGTTISTTQAVASVSGAVGSVTGNVGGNVTGSVGTVNALAANVITAATTAADFTTEIQAGLATAAALATVAGYIDTEVADIQARLPTALVAGRMASDAIAVSGSTVAADNLQIAFDDTAGPVPWMGIADQGTAQSATPTTVVLRAAAAFADDTIIGCTLAVFGSTQGYWQFREITDYAAASDTATVDTWTVTPSGTISYKVFGGPPAPVTLPRVDVRQVIGDPIVASSSKTTNWGGT